jgi:hypothetical protein
MYDFCIRWIYLKKEPWNYPCIHKINDSLDNANNWWNVYKVRLHFILKIYLMARIKDDMVDKGPNGFHLSVSDENK